MDGAHEMWRRYEIGSWLTSESGDNRIREFSRALYNRPRLHRGTTFAMGAAPAALGDAAVIDSLSAWIESTLAPISDADPAVLGKYVLALLKKDEPLRVLRANCARELADFLEDQTGGFVDALFARIDHEIERHDARAAAAAAAAADTGGTAEEDEVDYGEGSDSEESKEERPRGRREKEKDDAGVDDRRGSERSDDRRDGERRAREEPERRRRPGSRSPGRSRSASRDRDRRHLRGAPRPRTEWDRRDRARSPGGRFDGRDRRPPIPPGPPPGPPFAAPAVRTRRVEVSRPTPLPRTPRERFQSPPTAPCARCSSAYRRGRRVTLTDFTRRISPSSCTTFTRSLASSRTFGQTTRSFTPPSSSRTRRAREGRCGIAG